MREDDARFKYGARLRNNRHLDTRPNAGIEPNDTLVSGGRRKQQILQVGTENPDRLFLRFVTKPREEIRFQRRQALHAPRPAHDARQPRVRRTAFVRESQKVRNLHLTRMHGERFLFFGKQHLQRQHAFLTTAKKRERTVARHFVDAFAVVKVIAELRGFFGVAFVFHHRGHNEGMRPQPTAEHFEHIGVFRKAFRENVARAVQGGLHVRHPLFRRHKSRRFGFGRQRRIRKKLIRQRRQPRRDRDLRTRTALRLKGQIQVFNSLLAVRGFDLRQEFRRHLALFRHRRDDRRTAFFHFAPVHQCFLQIAKLRVVHPPGCFLTVAGDEGHRRPLIQQIHRSLHLSAFCAD